MLTKDYHFESERLSFRGIGRDDAEAIVAWRSDPANYLNFFNAAPVTLEQHLSWFETYLTNMGRFDFVIRTKDGTPVGTCGLSKCDEGCWEISYMIGAVEARGKGYAKEAVRALSEVAFAELGVERVIARILPHNTASMAVVAAEGFEECERVYQLTRQRQTTA